VVSFTPGGTARRSKVLGGWVGPKPGLDVLEKRKSLAPAGNRTPIDRSFNLWPSHCTHWATLASSC
jgi:hypothetical protein